VKFNGSQWKTWNKSNSQIPSDIVKSLAIELNGNLWIGTPSGVVEFNEDGIIN
jgi:ligand-binding sensor domain-containing protein